MKVDAPAVDKSSDPNDDGNNQFNLKKTYKKPQLIEHKSIAEETLAGSMGSGGDSGAYS